MRRRVNPRTDKRKFRRTAVNRKAINLSPVIYRGGIRL